MRALPLCSCIAAMLLSTQAGAQIVEEKRLTVTAPRGKAVNLLVQSAYSDPTTCTPLPPPRVSIATAPKLGQLTDRVGPHPVTDRTTGHGGCTTMKVDGRFVSYQAGSTPGRDTFKFYLVFDRGWSIEYNVAVDVR